MKLLPEVLPEFDELIALARVDSEIANAVCGLLEEGLPILRADVDWLSAKATGHGIVTYKLPKRIHALLLAARARHLMSDNTPIGNNYDSPR